MPVLTFEKTNKQDYKGNKSDTIFMKMQKESEDDNKKDCEYRTRPLFASRVSK